MSRPAVSFEHVVMRATVRDEAEVEDEHVLQVEGSYDPPVRGNRNGHPDTYTPDEGGEAELLACLDANGTDWEPHLTAKERESIEDQIRIHWEDSQEEPDYDDEPDYERASEREVEW